MRRRAGIGAIKQRQADTEKFKEKGSELAEAQLSQLSGQLEQFRTNLEIFATEHKQDIKKDPEFRKRFQEMCASIGVDPLASGKGFWSNMLDIGDFYYELGKLYRYYFRQILHSNCLCRCTNCGGLHGESAQNWRIDGAWGD